MDEFLVIMQVLDPSLEIEDVRQTFKMVGATDSLVEELFFDWCSNLFGDFDDDQFGQQMKELIEAQNQTSASASASAREINSDVLPEMDPSEARRREW